MSKIICEVCGTSYPETSAQCPICGYVHPMAGGVLPSDRNDRPADREYTYVKGGRFSQANVKKRNRAKTTAAAPVRQNSNTRQNGSHQNPQRQSNSRQSNSRQSTPAKKQSSGNTGLIITIIVLLLAIIAVIGYIFIKFFMPSIADNKKPEPETQAIQMETESEIETEEQTESREILLDETEITLTSVGETALIFADVLPDPGEDILEFASSDPLVATIDANGMVTAVGLGEATITVTCGTATTTCTIICDFIPPTEETTLPMEELVLNRTQIEFTREGERWVIYNGSIPEEDIFWSSDDVTVAVINNGVVTAAGNGTTTVYAEYGGVTASCEITCVFDDAQVGQEGNGGVSEDGGVTEDSGTTDTGAGKEYHLNNLYGGSAEDVTLAAGSSFPLRLVDEDGNEATGVTWSVQNSSVCSVDGDGDVTAKQSGYTYVIATYNGKEYRCIVRVP